MINTSTLLGLINQANPSSPVLSLNDVTFGFPQSDIGANYNTKITVSSVPGSGYFGTVDVFYHRIDLTELGQYLKVLSEEPFTSDLIIQSIGRNRVADLDVRDFEALTIPDLQIGDYGTITLTAEPKSLGWVGTTEVSLVLGLPENVDLLHTLMNFTLPSNGYLT